MNLNGSPALLSLLLFAVCCSLATGASAQEEGDAQAHVAAARDVAYAPGHDYTWIFDRLCAEPAPQADIVPTATAEAPTPPPARRIPPRSQWYQEPAKVFDNLYFVGSYLQSMWAVTTSEGIILHDTAFDYMVEAQIVEGLRTLGLDAADIEYVIVAHAHGDHYLGAKYLQDTFGSRIIMSEADWNVMATDDNPAELKPKKDIVATDGMALTLGDTTLRLYITPGHTPGTISTLIPVTDGDRHLAAIWGGNGFGTRHVSDPLDAYAAYSDSAKRFRNVAVEAGADVDLSSHTNHDKTLDKLNALRFRNPGDPHPFVRSDAVWRHLTLVGECADAQVDWARDREQ